MRTQSAELYLEWKKHVILIKVLLNSKPCANQHAGENVTAAAKI